jgi:phytoene dehydrogenase-like protein
MSPIVVVGAGLAGLACARMLAEADRQVLVLEATEAVGGRVRTDVVDGFRCDRGFQLINPAYPVLPAVIDLDHLDLRAFEAGVVVATGSSRSVLAHPRRAPRMLASTIGSPAGSMVEKLAFARWAASCLQPVRRLLSRPDSTLAENLDRAGVRGRLRTGVVDPFLAGVLADWDGTTSATFARLLVRSFLLGSPSVPSLGMSRLPELIAAGLPAGTVRLAEPALEVTGTRVRTAVREIRACVVVVAADPVTTARLTGCRAPAMKSLTTFWHTAPRPPTTARLLHLDAERRGPLVNTAVLTNVAPTYAPAGRTLIASTTLGADGSATTERLVRRQAGMVYGVDTTDWELVTCHVVTAALPVQPPPLPTRPPVRLANGVLVAGDHRATASIQGALVSGRRAAREILAHPSTR